MMYRLCTVHKDIFANYLSFRPILSAVNTPISKFSKILLPTLRYLTSNEYTVKNSFAFAEGIAKQDFEFIMGS